MPVDTVASVADSAPDTQAQPPRSRIEERVAAGLLALLPGAIVVYLSFEGGGFFAGSVALVTLLLTQILILRVLTAEHPFAGFSWRHAAVVGVFATYTGWTLASALWSNAEGPALVEFDRALLYTLLLLVFGLLPRSHSRILWITRGVAVGAFAICTVALITRLLPHVWPISAGEANNRLSYPITYWNALGILATIGILLMLGIAGNPRESRAARALAAAAVPITATTLFLTFSRGAILALAVGLLAYLVIGRSRALIGALLALLPSTGVAIVVVYHANLLATLTPTTAAAQVQGRRVAIVVAFATIAAGVLRWGTVQLDRWLADRGPRLAVSRRTARGGLAAGLAIVLAIALAAGGGSWVAKEYRGFFKKPSSVGTDLRARLTDPSSDGRADSWRVALKTFASAPIAGKGSGTYEFVWDRARPSAGPLVDAHNLYLETMAELGVVGALLLIATIVAILVALAWHARGPDRIVYAALFSAVLAWALHAALDWDWEMPAVTAWVFAVGGAALAAAPGRRGPLVGSRARVPLAAALVVAAITPVLLMLSQNHLERAANAFEQGDCTTAGKQALSSINVLAVRRQPYEILGYCDLDVGRSQDGVAAMSKAVRQEPDSWEVHYGLAIADGYAGIDPRAEIATAYRLDPLEPLVKQALRGFRGRSPARWVAAAKRAFTATTANTDPLSLH